jgi:enamine deaminase RidA (YjgF/YER057c/UK114 family)
MQNLVSVNIYVTDLKPEDCTRIREIRSGYFDAEKPPAVSLLGVQRLAFEGCGWRSRRPRPPEALFEPFPARRGGGAGG